MEQCSRTYGHYGSTIFDPMDASFLEVVFCDPCLADRMENVYEGINEKYQKELQDFRIEQDKLLEIILKDNLDENNNNS